MNWIFELKKKVPQFFKETKGKKVTGFFHYSLSGDLYDEDTKWGLGNTVFAVKIYYTLNLLDDLENKEKKSIVNFIQSFQKKDGTIYDPLIRRRALFRKFLSAVKNLDFSDAFGRKTIIAETRQSISALNLLGEKSKIPFKKFPKTKKEIEECLLTLNWQKPWGAGSHFSHLIFFLKNSDLKNKEKLINFAMGCVNKLQNPNDGSWYIGDPSLQQKINGAMKIITGLRGANRMNFRYPEKIIDLCLSAKNDEHACNNFNIIYVLHYANKMTDGNYRIKEIKEFAFERLGIYKQYYYSKIGGFSFLPHKANVYYYGAKITKGLSEPDIHGTCMFLWGISIIAQILGINQELGFKEQIP